MADLFKCGIDELFSRECVTEVHYDHCAQFPWNDDAIIRGVVCEGKKILQVTEGITDKFTFKIINKSGAVYNVQSECNISVSGAVLGGCNAGGDITVGRNLIGDNIHCEGTMLTVNGNVEADDIECDLNLTVMGNVEPDRIMDDVVCNALKCDRVENGIVIKNNE